MTSEVLMTRSISVRQLGQAVAILSALLAGVSFAGAPTESSELIALSDAWIEAEVGHDSAALERILDDRFLATLSSGKTLDRAAYINWIVKMALDPFKVLNDVVNIYGDTAVVIATTTDRQTKFTWVAIKRNGQWRVISETFSEIAGQK
jgi:hypothetical protein